MSTHISELSVPQLVAALAERGITDLDIQLVLNGNEASLDIIAATIRAAVRPRRNVGNTIASTPGSIEIIRMWLKGIARISLEYESFYAHRTSVTEIIRQALALCSDGYVDNIQRAIREQNILRKFSSDYPTEALEMAATTIEPLVHAVQVQLDALWKNRDDLILSVVAQHPDATEFKKYTNDYNRTRLYSRLQLFGFAHMAELTRFTRDEILSIRQIGYLSVELLEEDLQDVGLRLSPA